jgi:hypothetical protein
MVQKVQLVSQGTEPTVWLSVETMQAKLLAHIGDRLNFQPIASRGVRNFSHTYHDEPEPLGCTGRFH